MKPRFRRSNAGGFSKSDRLLAGCRAGEAFSGSGSCYGGVLRVSGGGVCCGEGEGVVEGFVGFSGVDLVGGLGVLGEDGEAVGRHFCEAAVEEVAVFGVDGVDAQLAGAEFAEEGGAVLEEAELAVVGGEGDGEGVALEDGLVRGEQVAV